MLPRPNRINPHITSLTRFGAPILIHAFGRRGRIFLANKQSDAVQPRAVNLRVALPIRLLFLPKRLIRFRRRHLLWLDFTRRLRRASAILRINRFTIVTGHALLVFGSALVALSRGLTFFNGRGVALTRRGRIEAPLFFSKEMRQHERHSDIKQRPAHQC